MKKLTKILLTSGASLMLATGGVMTYLQAQHPAESVSDLTLANIEALAVSEEDGVGPCCAPWENHCGTVHMENGLIFDVSGTPCN